MSNLDPRTAREKIVHYGKAILGLGLLSERSDKRSNVVYLPGTQGSGAYNKGKAKTGDVAFVQRVLCAVRSSEKVENLEDFLAFYREVEGCFDSAATEKTTKNVSVGAFRAACNQLLLEVVDELGKKVPESELQLVGFLLQDQRKKESREEENTQTPGQRHAFTAQLKKKFEALQRLAHITTPRPY